MSALAAISVTVSAGESSPVPSFGAGEPIDLSEFYGRASGTEGDSWFNHRDWKLVPRGLQNFGGVLFDVSGTLLLRSQNAEHLPAEVRGIPINGTYRYIHLLHGTGYADDPGTRIAAMEIHYQDGSKHTFPIVYGVHVRNWWQEPSEKVHEPTHSESAIVWRWDGKRNYPPPRVSLRLFRTTFDNPKPETPIDHIDFISENRQSTLCIVSVTVGNKQVPLPSTDDNDNDNQH